MFLKLFHTRLLLRFDRDAVIAISILCGIERSRFSAVTKIVKKKQKVAIFLHRVPRCSCTVDFRLRMPAKTKPKSSVQCADESLRVDSLMRLHESCKR